ncbi:MAG: hypothetical protein M5U15_11300 [Kiritimatiellae bacterium]|nr:hypothetical protein [Kiritimatiellia bacterium]
MWLGYIGFWYKGVTDAGGPVYFFETLAPLSLLFAFGLSRIWSRAGTHSVTRIAVVVAVLVGLLTWNTVFAVQESITRAPKQKSKSEFVEALNDLPPNSIALVEGFEEVRPGEIIMNAHGEDSDPLILRSLGDENVIVQRLFADRSAYLLRAENPDEPILLDQQPVRVRRLADTFHKRTRTKRAGRNRSRCACCEHARRSGLVGVWPAYSSAKGAVQGDVAGASIEHFVQCSAGR